MANTRMKPSLRLLRCYPLAVCVGPGAGLEPFRYTAGGLALDAMLVVVLPAVVLWAKKKHGERLFRREAGCSLRTMKNDL